MTDNPLERLARHVVATRYEDLPAQAVAAAKTFMLDSLGVAVAGSGDPWARRLAPLARAWGEGGEAGLLGRGESLPAGNAALVNAYFMHCLEFDCVHEGAVVHPMPTTLAPCLAACEREGAVSGRAISGRELLLAVVLGVDVAAVIGEAASGPMRFFRPATAGVWGGTAALCKLAGLDEETTLNALGAVYGQIGGTLQPHAEGSPLLAMQMGFNARAAFTAVELARGGLKAPRDVLVGQYGYFPLYEGGRFDLEPHLARLGSQWGIARLSHKPFPSGRLTHGGIDGILQLAARHGFGAGDVEGVRVRLPPLAYRLVGRPDVPDPTPNYARLCLRFVLATALLEGTVDVPHFTPERLTGAAVHALAARIELEPSPAEDENAITPQRIEVRLKGGETREIVLEHVLGHPEAPLSREDHLEKFRRNWDYGVFPLAPAGADRAIALVERLEALADVRELTALFRPQGDAH